MSRRGATRSILLALVGALLMPTCGVSESFLCEEAAARMARCCPGFDVASVTCPKQPDVIPDFGPSISCDGFPGWGGIDPTLLAPDERACIVDVPCADMAGVCDRFNARVQCSLQCHSDGDCGCTSTECRPFCVAGQCLTCTGRSHGCGPGEFCLDGTHCTCAPDAGDECMNPFAYVKPPCPEDATRPLCE